MAVKRNARHEAAATLGPGWQPLVLEPSPPADLSEPYKSDDPVHPDPSFEGGADATVVSPVVNVTTPNTISWTDLVVEKPDLAQFASERWLAAWMRLTPLPPMFQSTRDSLHQVAAYLLSPARRAATGKIGLRHCLEGFGTPFYLDGEADDAADTQIRIEGVDLVHQRGDQVDSVEISSLAECGQFLGMSPDTEWTSNINFASGVDLERYLPHDLASAGALAGLFGFAFSVLEELRADPESDQANRPQIWPERFDAAPGDTTGPNQEPYLYVSPWYTNELQDEFWNATSFPGAQLSYSDLINSSDQRDRALSFFTAGRMLIGSRQT